MSDLPPPPLPPPPPHPPHPTYDVDRSYVVSNMGPISIYRDPAVDGGRITMYFDGPDLKVTQDFGYVIIYPVNELKVGQLRQTGADKYEILAVNDEFTWVKLIQDGMMFEPITMLTRVVRSWNIST